MGTPRAEVINELTRYGSLIAKFNMGEYREATGITAHGESKMEGGYCAGICVDWIRRQLLGAAVRGYSEDRARRELNVLRMGAAFASAPRGGNFVAVSSSSDTRAKLQQLLSEQLNNSPVDFDGKLFQQPVKIPQATVKALMSLVDVSEDLTGEYKYEYLERSRVENLVRHLATRKVQGEQEWAGFAREMDEKFAQQRATNGRDVTSKPFSSLAVLKTLKQKSFASPAHWMGEILSSAIRPGCATMLNFELAELKGGVSELSSHGVVAHQINADTIYFLDPNYGIFNYSEKGLQSALQYLFWTGTTSDKPIYGEDNSTVNNKVGYVVFGRADSVNPFA